MKTLNEMLENQMQDEKFRKEYEEMQPEFDVIRAIVDARTSQNLTQKELSERTGINQADISKLENGTRNPSVSLLKRLAEGMGMVLKIEFIHCNGCNDQPEGKRCHLYLCRNWTESINNCKNCIHIEKARRNGLFHHCSSNSQ